MEIAMMILYLSIGVLAGLMSGIFGIGGGSIRIPLLNLAGLPLVAAFGINLLVIPFSSSIGAITQRKNIDAKVSVYVIAGGALGSVAGALFVGLISNILLAMLFLITATVTVVVIHLDRIAPSRAESVDPDRRTFLGLSFLLNLITGLRGGSGGSLFPPFLRAMKLDIHRAIATSLFVTAFTAVFAAVIYWHRGDIAWLPALYVLAGSILGARAGSRISMKAQPGWLENGLSVLIVVLATLTVFKAW